MSLTALLEAIARFEEYDSELRAVGLRLVANQYGLSIVQVWHLRKIYLGQRDERNNSTND